MRHPLPGDLEWVDGVLDVWPCTLRWDVKGHTPSLPALQGRLWDGVATQRVALDGDGAPCALLQLVDVDLVNGIARVEAIARHSADADVVAAVDRFVALAGADFPLRRGYVHAVADGFDAGRALPAARLVGRLRGCHLRDRGHYEDVVIHEIDFTEPGSESGAVAAAAR